MGQINLIRVLLGGFVAGIVYNVGEAILNIVVLGGENEAMVKKFNLPPMDNSFVAKMTVLMFAVGVLTVFLYAAIRPRFGAGVKTAAIAGVLVWLLSFVYLGLVITTIGLFPVGPTVLSLGWELVEACLAAIAGAWVYRE